MGNTFVLSRVCDACEGVEETPPCRVCKGEGERPALCQHCGEEIVGEAALKSHTLGVQFCGTCLRPSVVRRVEMGVVA